MFIHLPALPVHWGLSPPDRDEKNNRKGGETSSDKWCKANLPCAEWVTLWHEAIEQAVSKVTAAVFCFYYLKADKKNLTNVLELQENEGNTLEIRSEIRQNAMLATSP